MTTCVAFVRGINVGGHHPLPMAELRALLEDRGYENVRTHIQSGNVIFDASATEPELCADVADAIYDAFEYEVPVMVRTLEELEAVVDHQPFDLDGEDTIKHYVTFLDSVPDADAVDDLLAAQSDAERFVVHGREVYTQIDKAILGPGTFTDVETLLGQPTTRRTWNVVTAVAELARGSPA